MPTRIFLLFAALLQASLAQALGLGGITGSGRLGERLDAYVPLYLAPGERATLTGVEILPDTFARDIDTPLGDLRAALATEGNRSYVHVTSSTPLAVEQLRFRLRVTATRGAAVARYALRVPTTSAVVPSSPSTPTRTSRRPVIVARPSAAVTPDTSASNANRYGPVRSGESLWTIASGIAEGPDVNSTMQMLYAMNPTAFIDGDMSRLRAGVMLVLPDDEGDVRTGGDGKTDDAASSPADVSSAADIGDASSNMPRTSTRVDDASGALLDDTTTDAGQTDVIATDTMAAAAQSPAPQADSSTRPYDAALAERLAALDAKFAAIRAKYGTASARPAATAPPATRPAATVQRKEKAVSTPPPAPRREEASSAPRPRPAAPPETASRDGWIPLIGVSLLAVLLLAMLPTLQRRFVAHRTRAKAATFTAADANRRAEVARKAESRVRLEWEIEGLLQRKATPSTRPADGQGDTAPPVSPLERTIDPLAITQGGALLDGDREVAIDANIAHGRYAEAEALLREVIAAHPRNVQAKLRLAEVYYITEKLEGFAAIALELKERHRGDLSDEDWQRVVRMGKIVAPDLALFSGPKAVTKRA